MGQLLVLFAGGKPDVYHFISTDFHCRYPLLYRLQPWQSGLQLAGWEKLRSHIWTLKLSENDLGNGDLRHGRGSNINRPWSRAALLINSLDRFGDLYKAIYFLPVMAALLAMALVWDLALHPTVGIVNQTLRTGCETWVEGLLSFGWLPWVDGAESWYSTSCADEFPLWIGDRDYAMPTICFIGIWQAFGFNMVLYLAGLTGVPRELYHAAAIDGVTNGWDRFRLVTWPMLGPTTVFVVTITSINSFKVFDTVEALTWGGPAKSTYVMMYAIFEKAVKENQVGFGSAITVIFLLFVLIITFTQRYLVEKRVHYS